MKYFYLFLFTFLLGNVLIAQSTYNGNGATGFGGGIGASTLSVTDDGTTATFTLTRGTGNVNDFFVLYIDSKVGGFNNTSTLNDQNDANRRAISGVDGGNRSVANFASGFDADYALSVNTSFGGFWELAAGGNNSLAFIKSTGVFSSNAFTTYTFTLTKTELGIAAMDPFVFKFTAALISGTAFRSNEGYGAGLPATNPGNGPVTYTSFLVYPLIVTPLNLNTFTGSVRNESVELKWSTLSEANLSKFVLLKSTNGLTFTELAEIAPKNIATGASYSYIDNNLNLGNNYYRLVAKNTAGAEAFSKIIKIIYGKIDNTLTLYPNPTREFLKINFMSAVRGSYSLNIYNDAGQVLIHQDFEHNGVDRTINLTLPTSMKKGPYRVHISNQYEFYKGTFIVQ